MSVYCFILTKTYCTSPPFFGKLYIFLEYGTFWNIKTLLILIISLYFKISQSVSWHEISCSAALSYTASLVIPSTAWNTTLPADMFYNKLVPLVYNNIPKCPPFCYFTSFSVVLVTPFINKLKS